MSDARNDFRQALRRRRTGIMGELPPDAEFPVIKPVFYADAKILSDDALRTFEKFRTSYPPYGLLDADGNPFLVRSGSNPWFQLNYALRATGRAAVEQAIPTIDACPYHETLAKRIGRTSINLASLDNNNQGLDTLRGAVIPGAELNAPLFVSLLRRLPAIQRLHGSDSNPEAFARNSVRLIQEPLMHPRQWAAAFVYSLGSLGELLSPNFLNDELALKYTNIDLSPEGKERLTWAMPTEKFTLRQDTTVISRALSAELDGDQQIVVYPAGTRLEDISINEPTIGCPGKQLAFAMWDRTIDAIVRERLWDADKSSQL